MILDDEDILIASVKECTTNPIITLKNRFINRGKFIKEDILILNEIIEDFNKNNPNFDFLAKKIKFDVDFNCIHIFKNNPAKDKIFSIYVNIDNDVKISFSYIPALDIVREYMVSKYKLKQFRFFKKIYTLDI